MSTKSILFVALVLWYLFSAYWYVCRIKNHACNCFTSQAGIPPLIIKDNEKQIVNIPDNFKFTQSAASPVISTPVKEALNQTANYLLQHPNRALIIKGHYTPEEVNQTPFDNLGIARADALKRQLMASGIPETRILTAASEVKPMPLFSDQTFFGGYDFEFTDAGDTNALPRFLVLDSNTTVVDVADNFSFRESEAKPVFSPAVQKGMEDLTVYLTANPKKQLVLTGSYEAKERNNTMFDNLGLARADALKQLLLAKGIPADRIQGASRQNDALPRTPNGQITGAVAFSMNTATQSELPTFTVKDGSETVVDVPDNFRFRASSDKPEMSKEVQNGLATLGHYAKTHPDRRLKITGSFAPEEKNNTAFNNLGIARANALKTQLVALGADSSNINIDSKPDAQLVQNNGSITGGIDFMFQVTAARKVDLTAQSRTLYFNSGSAELAMTDELRQYFKDVKTLLEQDPKAAVNLTGHTDNVGNQPSNQKLGLKRANEVKQQLVRIGIHQKRVSTESKGQTNPVQSNETDEGKKANRRVEMIIK
ncbi:MAG: OmpA family protein [Sphingobacteriales bacterium]|nr:MAG: OmpA family protein [Sphingobacteriales bacterium]